MIEVKPLTKKDFSAFGQVIELDGAEHFTINQGFTERFHDLAKVDVANVGGKPIISIFEGTPHPKPIVLKVMERHPLGSQAFYPLQNHSWIVVVACGDNPLDPANIRAFHARGDQGVNYAVNTWHHPLLVLHRKDRFLIVDRSGPGNNLEEREFEQQVLLDLD